MKTSEQVEGQDMKTREQVEEMLNRFDGLDMDDFEGEPAEGIRETLLWVLGHRDDYSITGYFQ